MDLSTPSGRRAAPRSSQTGDLLRVLATLELDEAQRGWLGELIHPEPVTGGAMPSWRALEVVDTASVPLPPAPPPPRTSQLDRSTPDQTKESAAAQPTRKRSMNSSLATVRRLRRRTTIVIAAAAVMATGALAGTVSWLLFGRSARQSAAVAAVIALALAAIAVICATLLAWRAGWAERVVLLTRPPERQAPAARGVSGVEAEEFENTRWFPPPRAESLVPANELRSFAMTLARQRTLRDIDLLEVLRLTARRETITRLPRLAGWSVARGVQVHVQRSASMLPFAGDAAGIGDALATVIEPSLLDVFGFEHDPMLLTSPTRRLRSVVRASGEPLLDPDEGCPVELVLDNRRSIIVVTDLGIGLSRSDPLRAPTSRWLEHYNTVRNHCPAVLYLVPYPPARWPTEAADLPCAWWCDDLRASAVHRALQQGRR
ncbi:MAG: hypothetical protein AB7O92_12095 [Acidimicrobiia bacterium]